VLLQLTPRAPKRKAGFARGGYCFWHARASKLARSAPTSRRCGSGIAPLRHLQTWRPQTRPQHHRAKCSWCCVGARGRLFRSETAPRRSLLPSRTCGRRGSSPRTGPCIVYGGCPQLHTPTRTPATAGLPGPGVTRADSDDISGPRCLELFDRGLRPAHTDLPAGVALSN